MKRIKPRLKRMAATEYSLNSQAQKFKRLTDAEYQSMEKEILSKVKRRKKK